MNELMDEWRMNEVKLKWPWTVRRRRGSQATFLPSEQSEEASSPTVHVSGMQQEACWEENTQTQHISVALTFQTQET